jgi:hypothetical protein
MLGKCTNPSCSASFRYMEEGTLFRLETDPVLGLSNPKRPEYYWLCRSCSAAMTLHIKEGKVVPVALPAPLPDVLHNGVPHKSDFIWPKREGGLTLSDVRSSTEKKRRGGGVGGR